MPRIKKGGTLLLRLLVLELSCVGAAGCAATGASVEVAGGGGAGCCAAERQGKIILARKNAVTRERMRAKLLWEGITSG